MSSEMLVMPITRPDESRSSMSLQVMISSSPSRVRILVSSDGGISPLSTAAR